MVNIYPLEKLKKNGCGLLRRAFYYSNTFFACCPCHRVSWIRILNFRWFLEVTLFCCWFECWPPGCWLRSIGCFQAMKFKISAELALGSREQPILPYLCPQRSLDRSVQWLGRTEKSGTLLPLPSAKWRNFVFKASASLALCATTKFAQDVSIELLRSLCAA